MNRDKMTLASLAGRNQSSGYLDGPVDIEGGDDTIIAAKRGEYVIPEEVVRYVGLDKLNKMVEQAKMKMGEQNPQEHMEPKGLPGYNTGGYIKPGIDISGIERDQFGMLTDKSRSTLDRMFQADYDTARNDVDRWRIKSTNDEIMRSLMKPQTGLPGYATGGYIEDKPKMSLASLASTQQQNANMFKPQQPQMSQGLPGEAIPNEQNILGTIQGSEGFNAIRRGPQGPYTDTTPLSYAQGAGLSDKWNVNEPGDLSKVEVIRGGLRGAANDPMWQQMEQYKAAPGMMKDESKQEIAGIKAAAQQEIAANKLTSLAELQKDRLANSMEIAKMRGDRAFQTALVRAARGDDNRDFRNESAMRKEFLSLPEVKEFPTISTNAKRAVAALREQGNGSNVAVDQSVITVFNKMLDPASVVRESEYARTPQDLSILSRIKGKWDKVQRGGAGLDATERAALGRMVNNFAGIANEQYNAQVDYYSGLSKRYGYNPENIVRLGGRRAEAQGVGGQGGSTPQARDTSKLSNYFGANSAKMSQEKLLQAARAQKWSDDEIKQAWAAARGR